MMIQLHLLRTNLERVQMMPPSAIIHPALPLVAQVHLKALLTPRQPSPAACVQPVYSGEQFKVRGIALQPKVLYFNCMQVHRSQMILQGLEECGSTTKLFLCSAGPCKLQKIGFGNGSSSSNMFAEHTATHQISGGEVQSALLQPNSSYARHALRQHIWWQPDRTLFMSSPSSEILLRPQAEPPALPSLQTLGRSVDQSSRWNSVDVCCSRQHTLPKCLGSSVPLPALCKQASDDVLQTHAVSINPGNIASLRLGLSCPVPSNLVGIRTSGRGLQPPYEAVEDCTSTVAAPQHTDQQGAARPMSHGTTRAVVGSLLFNVTKPRFQQQISIEPYQCSPAAAQLLQQLPENGVQLQAQCQQRAKQWCPNGSISRASIAMCPGYPRSQSAAEAAHLRLGMHCQYPQESRRPVNLLKDPRSCHHHYAAYSGSLQSLPAESALNASALSRMHSSSRPVDAAVVLTRWGRALRVGHGETLLLAKHMWDKVRPRVDPTLCLNPNLIYLVSLPPETHLYPLRATVPFCP